MRIQLLLFLFLPFLAHSQEGSVVSVIDSSALIIDSLGQSSDSIIKKRNFIGKFLKDGYPEPKKAVLLSFVIPGGGQLYNKQYWKIPIAYATIGGAIYAIDFNSRNYKRYRDAFRIRRDGDPETIDDVFVGLTDENVRSRRNQFLKNREMSVVALAAAYIFNSADAFVSAHLKPFDVSDDLTLEIGPTLNSNPNDTQNFGFGIKLKQRVAEDFAPPVLVYGLD